MTQISCDILPKIIPYHNGNMNFLGFEFLKLIIFSVSNVRNIIDFWDADDFLRKLKITFENIDLVLVGKILSTIS